MINPSSQVNGFWPDLGERAASIHLGVRFAQKTLWRHEHSYGDDVNNFDFRQNDNNVFSIFTDKFIP